MPCGGEFEHLVRRSVLSTTPRDETVSLQLREHPRERLRPLCAAAASAPAEVGPCLYTWLSTLSLLRLRPSAARSARRRWASRSVPCRTPAAVSLSRSNSTHFTIVRYSLLYWTQNGCFRSRYTDVIGRWQITLLREHFRFGRDRAPGALRPPPGALPGAVVAMTVTLACFGSALALEHFAHLHLDIVIEAVVLAATVSRVQRWPSCATA